MRKLNGLSSKINPENTTGFISDDRNLIVDGNEISSFGTDNSGAKNYANTNGNYDHNLTFIESADQITPTENSSSNNTTLTEISSSIDSQSSYMKEITVNVIGNTISNQNTSSEVEIAKVVTTSSVVTDNTRDVTISTEAVKISTDETVTALKDIDNNLANDDYSDDPHFKQFLESRKATRKTDADSGDSDDDLRVFNQSSRVKRRGRPPSKQRKR